MLAKEEMYNIFQDACENQGNIRILLNLVNKKVTPNVCKFVATFSTQGWKDKRNFEFVAYHEVGHPSYMPEWYEDHLKYFSLLSYIFNNGKTTKDLDDLMFVANVIYDMMVDRRNQKEFKVDLQGSIENILINLSNGDIENSGSVYILLICFYCRCFGKKPTINFDYPFEKIFLIAAKKCLQIVDSKFSKLEKLKKIAFIINNLIYDNNETLSDAVDKAKNSNIDLSNSDNPSMSQESDDPISDALDNGDIDEDMFDYFFEKEDGESDKNDDEEIPKSWAKDYNDNKNSRHIEVREWIDYAKKNVDIFFKNESKAKVKGVGNNKDGLMVRSGTWNENDNINNLDMLSTISSHGLFIPGEYAIKKSIMSENLKDKENNYNLHIVLDTSGSIVINQGCIALFSLIEFAKRKNNNVSASLFHDKLYYTASINKSFSKCKVTNKSKYKTFQYDIADCWQNGGTHLPESLLYLKEKLIDGYQTKRESNLTVIITDFQDDYHNIITMIEDINLIYQKSNMIIVAIGDRIDTCKERLNPEIKLIKCLSVNGSVADILKNITI